jgi:hypothetical protein
MSASRSPLSAEPIQDVSPSELARQMAARLGGRQESRADRGTGSGTRLPPSWYCGSGIAISLGTHPSVLWGEAWERV